MQDPTQRFSDRVENYVKYRPTYPQAVIDTLRDRCGLTSASVISDVGSGTGILAEMFLRNGNTVFGVEPNREMREAGEKLLADYPNFHSVEGAAEATTLPTASMDFVTAGQAFHWFDPPNARAEFARILKPGGWVAMVWNVRQVDTTPFLADYEALLQQYGTDYNTSKHRDLEDDTLDSFYAPQKPQLEEFPNRQEFDFNSLEGRLRSSSYTPAPGTPNYEPMLQALRRIFDKRQQGGKVAFEYITRLYYGRIEK